MIVTLFVGILIGFIMGFLTGTRAKQLASAAKRIPRALASLRNVLRDVIDSDQGVGQASLPEDEVREEDEQEVISRFLNVTLTPGLDDHKDVTFNPIVLYQMRKAKDELRQERAREAMRLEGIDPDNVENAEALAIAKGWRSPLAFLIANGARVTPVADDNAEARAQKERRRQLKNIEVYLTRQLKVEANRQERNPAHTKRVGISVHKETALDVALEMKSSPRVGRLVRQLHIAKAARSQLKVIQRIRPLPIQIQQQKDEQERQEAESDAAADHEMGEVSIMNKSRRINARTTEVEGTLDVLRREFAEEFAFMDEVAEGEEQPEDNVAA